jgi:hypothetical protein
MNIISTEESVRVIVRIRPPVDEQVLKVMNSPIPDEYLSYICTQPASYDDITSLKISPNYHCTCPACVSKYSMEVKIEQYGSLMKTNHDKLFKFSRVFGWNISQKEIFHELSSYLEASIEGYNSAIVSAGPPKSGKTYTLFGTNNPTSNNSTFNTFDEVGIVPIALLRLFEMIEERKQADINAVYEIEMSFLELNNNHFRNLLKDEDNPTSGNNNNMENPHFGLNRSMMMSTDEMDEIRGVIKSLNPIDPSQSSYNMATVTNQKIEVKESSVLGIYFQGSSLRYPVRNLEEALTLLKIAEKNRAAKGTTDVDGVSFR